MAAMNPSNVLAIIEKNDSDRITVVLPVRSLFSWPTENIAFFCSTGQSGVESFNGTYFPMLGVYVDDRTTPLPDGMIDSSIKLVRNYFVKTSSISFLAPKVSEMQEWIFTLLKEYCESEVKLDLFQLSLNDIRGKTRTEIETRKLYVMYTELDLIFRCLSSYFTDRNQVFLSISLSDTFKSGVWLSDLKGFADYMKRISGKSYEIIDKKVITSDDKYAFLTRNSAQCEFTRLHETLPPTRLYKVNSSSYMYDVLYRNRRSLEIEVNALDRLAAMAAEREKRAELAERGAKGGKSRRYKRKSRKNRKSRKVITKSRYV